ncbi:metalloregulator ArsR/SmtB family transcription factor [Desulfurobacterium sp.]|uniref:ArsR/SmtB family transcription factor n=1 Tax=Desulfurobacterium sp. TaxID=2004706 RepID=UPI00262ED869|nr:metalloregulator ArsR/SmtB family transcription factor [Desulfurobacterium sp.]
MREFAEAMKILGEPNRLRIVKMLQERSAYVCEIAQVLGISMATVSTHLSVLKRFHLVEDKREGVKILYSLSSPPNKDVEKLLEFLKDIGEDWEITKRDRKHLNSIHDVDEICSKQTNTGI